MSDRGRELCDAAKDGDEGRMSELLAVDGINVNYKSRNGWSPLHIAAFKGHAHIIRLLHQAKADLESGDNFGQTPLHMAGANGHRECAALLLLLGAKIDSLNEDNDTPIHYASREGKTDTVKLLIECGSDTTLRNNDGKTPSDLAKKEEIKSLFEEFKQKEGHENNGQLLKNALDAEKWGVATILALNGASEDPEIFKDLLISATNSENIKFDCVLALLARLEGDLSSLDDETKIKMLSAAVQSKNSVAVKTLFAANVDEDGHTLGEAIGTDISGGALKKRLVCDMENTLEQEALEMGQKNSMYCA